MPPLTRSILVPILVLITPVLGACTSAEPASSPAPEPQSTPPEPTPMVELEPDNHTARSRQEFGPAIGGPLLELPSAPGRYASEFNYTQSKLITMEHTIDKARSGTIVLELAPDGGARLCQTLKQHSRSSISRYGSRDGKARHSEDSTVITLALTGRWTTVSDGVELTVHFDRLAHHTCDVPADAPSGGISSELRCFTTPGNSTLPSAALVCALATDDSLLDDAALLLADSPRAGSWALRSDPAMRPRIEAPPADALAYLVLGADPGLRIISSEDRRTGPELRFELAKVADPKVQKPIESP